MPASEKTALEAVMEADEERVRLEKLAEELATMEDDAAQDYLMEVTLIKLISNNVLGEFLTNS
jgi:ATP-binding cassette subfamily F protein 2